MSPLKAAETRTAVPAGDEPGETGTVVSGDLSYLCDPACPICTDTTPPEKWDAPWPAFRWSTELEETK